MNTTQDILKHLRDQYELSGKYCQIGRDLDGFDILKELGELNQLPFYVTQHYDLDVKLYLQAIDQIRRLLNDADTIGLADFLLYHFVPLMDELIALDSEVSLER